MGSPAALCVLLFGSLVPCAAEEAAPPPAPVQRWSVNVYGPQSVELFGDELLVVGGSDNVVLAFSRDSPPRVVASLPAEINVIAASPDRRLLALGGFDDGRDCRGDGQVVERVTIVRVSDGAQLWHVDAAINERPTWLDGERVLIRTSHWGTHVRASIDEVVYDASSGRTISTRHRRATRKEERSGSYWRRAWIGPNAKPADWPGT